MTRITDEESRGYLLKYRPLFPAIKSLLARSQFANHYHIQPLWHVVAATGDDGEPVACRQFSSIVTGERWERLARQLPKGHVSVPFFLASDEAAVRSTRIAHSFFRHSGLRFRSEIQVIGGQVAWPIYLHLAAYSSDVHSRPSLRSATPVAYIFQPAQVHRDIADLSSAKSGKLSKMLFQKVVAVLFDDEFKEACSRFVHLIFIIAKTPDAPFTTFLHVIVDNLCGFPVVVFIMLTPNSCHGSAISQKKRELYLSSKTSLAPVAKSSLHTLTSGADICRPGRRKIQDKIAEFADKPQSKREEWERDNGIFLYEVCIHCASLTLTRCQYNFIADAHSRRFCYRMHCGIFHSTMFTTRLCLTNCTKPTSESSADIYVAHSLNTSARTPTYFKSSVLVWLKSPSFQPSHCMDCSRLPSSK